MISTLAVGFLLLASCQATHPQNELFSPGGLWPSLNKACLKFVNDASLFVKKAIEENEGVSLNEMKKHIKIISGAYNDIIDHFDSIQAVVKDTGLTLHVDVNMDLVRESIQETLPDVKDHFNMDDIFNLILEPVEGLDEDGVRLDAAFVALSHLSVQLNNTAHEQIKTVSAVKELQAAVEILHAKLWAAMQILESILDKANDAGARLAKLQKERLAPTEKDLQDYMIWMKKQNEAKLQPESGVTLNRVKRQTRSSSIPLSSRWSLTRGGLTYRRGPLTGTIGGGLSPPHIRGSLTYQRGNWGLTASGRYDFGRGWSAGLGFRFSFRR